MNRSELHTLFAEEFSQPRLRPAEVSQNSMRIESELGIVLPQSYLDFVRAHGNPFTPSILGLVVDHQAGVTDVSEFLSAEEVVKNSRLYWTGGMSEDLIGFASDSMGNMFCFRRLATGQARPDEAEVWFFDHDFCSESKLADSFDEFILSYLALKRPDQVVP